MDNYDGKNVMNGTYGEVWIDGDYVAEAIGLQAKVTLSKSDVNICKKLGKSYKVTGYEGKGTLKLNHVTSRMSMLISDNIKQGKETVCNVISKLSDPDAFGAERVSIKDVTFDEFTLADWEAKKNGEESVAFTFSDWDYLDRIDPDKI